MNLLGDFGGLFIEVGADLDPKTFFGSTLSIRSLGFKNRHLWETSPRIVRSFTPLAANRLQSKTPRRTIDQSELLSVTLCDQNRGLEGESLSMPYIYLYLIERKTSRPA